MSWFKIRGIPSTAGPKMRSTVNAIHSLEPKVVDPQINLVRLNLDMIPQQISNLDKELTELAVRQKKLTDTRRILTRVNIVIKEEMAAIEKEAIAKTPPRQQNGRGTTLAHDSSFVPSPAALNTIIESHLIRL